MAGLPPPPINDSPGSFTWLEWYRQLRNYVSTSGSVPWYIINFSGSNITDIAQRDHNQLQNTQGGVAGEKYHLTQEEHASLSSGVDYGAFQDNTTQTHTSTGVAKAITLDTVDFVKGVSRDGTTTSKIYVAKTGVYNLQFSCQLHKTSASVGYIYIWPAINGTAVPDSATKVAVQGSTAETVAAWNFLLQMNANDYVELMWSVSSTDCELLHEPASSPVPAIPSAIVTITQVNTI